MRDFFVEGGCAGPESAPLHPLKINKACARTALKSSC
jgi:hypothetical protein